MRISATIFATSLIWWGCNGGEFATMTDTIIFILTIIVALIIAVYNQSKIERK